MNRVILMGNLTREPELKNIGTTNVANFGIAINRVVQGGAKETTFVDISAFGKCADNIGKYFQKGKPILIEGRLKLDEWQDTQTQQKRSKLKVVAERFFFCGSNAAPQGAPARQAAPQTSPHDSPHENCRGGDLAAPTSPFV